MVDTSRTQQPDPDATTDRVAGEPPRVSPWGFREKIGRVAWSLVRAWCWRWIPRPWWPLRSAILRCFGATIGRQVRIDPTVAIEIPWHLTIDEGTRVCERAILYCLGSVRIGRECLVGPYAHICAGTHDYTSTRFTLLRPPIVIGDRCTVLTASLIGPGVTLAPGTVVRERAGVFTNTRPHTIYSGTPAKAEHASSTPSLEAGAS